ncbi:DUF4240 domain-containing protein [Nonomuraea gerenzanensis]|uniref:DUF4240 domain-containing protein n=1 Tax=Nonomuraea gerenzanensis TaxID=93944 RepID=A0A1M4EIB0_9ACTN|nr:DUF4240 domain-containing protein [Nonomuraea gerenzanensis]UBU10161.1 DUF4240 domain-containing protein [Nonomuraea gerenzanensis]SBO98536.1 hypothetical protein BN4615_P8052 [Nonomuraea gerenzanensis]
MDLEPFWELVERARADAGGDALGQIELLVEWLSRTSAARVREFGAQWEQAMDALYTWELWGAGAIMLDFCSDDGFEYFRAWLVCHGRRVAEVAATDPDRLAELELAFVDGDATLEEALGVAHRAHTAITGDEEAWWEEDDDIGVGFSGPAGEPWPTTVEGFAARWPRLWRAYGPRAWLAPPCHGDPADGLLNIARPPTR